MTYLIVSDAIRPGRRVYWNRYLSRFVSEVSPQCYFLTTYTAQRAKHRLLDFYRFKAIRVLKYERACEIVNSIFALSLESLPNMGSNNLEGWHDV